MAISADQVLQGLADTGGIQTPALLERIAQLEMSGREFKRNLERDCAYLAPVCSARPQANKHHQGGQLAKAVLWRVCMICGCG